MEALLDGDIYAFRVACTTENDNEAIAVYRVNEMIENTLAEVEASEYKLFFTSPDNFRKHIYPEYKANRTATKPKHLQFLRDYLVKEWGASISEGEEADDLIAIRATTLGDDSIIISLDKDFDQVQGWHYNFVKQKKYYVSAEEGLRFFYKQILMGDKADNIVGIKGVGPVKAEKMLAKATTPESLYAVCLEALGAERTLENGQLLWLRRTPNQLWQAPLTSVAST